jgi:hypothetical protein
MPILAFVFAATAFVTGAMAAHLPRLLETAGASATVAIAASALVGPAQVGARLIEFGALRLVHPLVSARLSTILHPLGAAALALFGPLGYGPRTGLLGAPARATQALGPVLFGLLLDRMGAASIAISAALCLAAFFALLLLKTQAEPAPAVA